MDASQAASQMREVDRVLDRETRRETLDPSRERASTLAELDERLAPGPEDGARRAAFRHGLARLGLATQRNFPGNLFWDFDSFAASLSALDSVEGIRRTADLAVALFDGFGCNSAINFRYIHDFTYGYDWARWVAKAARDRAAVGPFSYEFLSYLEGRRGELLELIARNDEKYGQLPAGVPRNPFRFAREPDQERRLLETMVTEDLIPVRAWAIDGHTTWNRPFTELREACAEKLGIPVRRKT